MDLFEIIPQVPYLQKKFWIYFWDCDWNRLGIRGQGGDHFKSGQILILCQTSNCDQNSKLYCLNGLSIVIPTIQGSTSMHPVKQFIDNIFLIWGRIYIFTCKRMDLIWYWFLKYKFCFLQFYINWDFFSIFN